MNLDNQSTHDLKLCEHLRHNAFLSDKYKMIYVSTPKVACTSLKWWFASLENVSKDILACQNSEESDPDLIVHDTFHKVAPNVAGLEPEIIVDSIASGKYFSFAIVRNPYKRIFSAWQSKILLKEPLQIAPYEKFEFIHLPVRSVTEVASAFEGFLEHLAAYESPHFWDVHWTTQAKLLRPDIINYSNLSKIEELTELRARLVAHLGNGVLDPFAVKPVNESLIPYRREFFSEKSISLIQAMYKDDFEKFNYPLDLPEDSESFSESQLLLSLKAIGLIRGRHQRLSEIRTRLAGKVLSIDSKYQNTTREFQNTTRELMELLSEKEQSINWLKQGAADARRELKQVLESTSWTITKPIRYFKLSVLGRAISMTSFLIGKLSRTIWHRMPISYEMKSKFKDFMFSNFAFIFNKSPAYRSWRSINFSESDFGLSRDTSALKKNDLYVPLIRTAPPANLPVRVIALYLPQFHAIKENDEWWGRGFTEWTNVKPAKPQFDGHYQPHVPDELGYYNLLNRETQFRQIELAKLYGVSGFCFYYYWFGGKRLLEQPIENYLADSSLDHPFCLCWANENWSRRWDGKDSQILIAQQHSPEDDIAFAADIARYLRDDRYIKIDGKPLLVVYRPSLLPSAFETSVRWREWFRAEGMGEIYLAYTQSFEVEDPRNYGFDAAIEFPPNNSAPPNITSNVEPVNSSLFDSTVYDWSIFPERALRYKKNAYRLFRSVCPSWDNTARRKNKGTVFQNSSPEKYQSWLELAIADTCENIPSKDERLIFVNAWNEWAEGAHLEPDQKYGYAWLDATRKALTGEGPGQPSEKIAVVSHDAHPHGAQFLALGMVRSLANDLKFEVHTVLLGDGRLKGEFSRYSSVNELFLGAEFSTRTKILAKNLVAKGVSRAIINTTVSGVIVEIFKEEGIRCVTLVHEMPGVIEANNLQPQTSIIVKNSDKVVFPAKIVEEGFKNFTPLNNDNSIIRPQGLWRRNFNRFRKNEVRLQVRSRLGVAEDAPLVLAVGYADRRKGVDLFARAALGILEQIPSAIFVWIGHWDEELRREVDIIIDGKSDSFKFLGYEPDTARYHAAADVYALASREDPFPNVVLESFDAAVPVVAFSGTGGGAHLVSKIGGRVVPAEDVQAFASTIVDLLNHPEVAKELGAQASTLVDRDYAFRSYLFDVCDFAGVKLPKISVVVPNYNYATHISRRLDSIVNQTLPIFELIILDDASTDSSVSEIIEWLEKNNVESKLIINDKNSGCVFDQWAKGVEVATGDYIWIAEADDLSLPQFLEAVLSPLERDSEVTLSFCESQQIDGIDNIVSLDYKNYRADVCEEHWHVPFINKGADEVANYMAIKNTIPNVSSVLFRSSIIKKVFAENLKAIRSLNRAGDWLAYVEVLKYGKIAFSPRPLNLHRRHSGSVIGGSNTKKLVEEISVVQRHIVKHFPVSEKSRAQAESYLKGLHIEHRLGARTLDHD